MIFTKIIVVIFLGYLCVRAVEFVVEEIGAYYAKNSVGMQIREMDVFMLKCISIITVVGIAIIGIGCYILHLIMPWLVS